jgi:hypothetical protein
MAIDERSVEPAAIEAEINEIQSLGLDALRTRWRATFGRTPPAGLTKDNNLWSGRHTRCAELQPRRRR